MIDAEEERPMETIRETWRQYRSWATTARQGKISQDRAHNWTLILGLLGAALATGASQLESQNLVTTLSILSGFLIASAAFLGKELLTPERETIWARCRMVAEAIQRQAWLALLRVPPYDDRDAGKKLVEMTQQLVKGEKLTKATRVINDRDMGFPAIKTVEDYIDKRVQEQIKWYRGRAKSCHEILGRWRNVSLALGLLAVFLSGFGVLNPAYPAWVPVVTSMSAAVLALVQAGRLQSIPPLYQQTADQLAIQLARWKDGAHQTLSDVEFVTTCEDIMAHENESWRTEWLSKEAMDKTRKAYEKVQESPPRSESSAQSTDSAN